MTALGNYSSLLTAAFGIALLLATAYIGVRAGTEKTLRQQRDDALTDNDALRKARADRDAEIVELREELARTKARMDVLQSVVTGEVHWTALGDVLEGHVRDTGHRLDHIEEMLAETLVELRARGH